jgi:hypothetical protein
VDEDFEVRKIGGDDTETYLWREDGYMQRQFPRGIVSLKKFPQRFKFSLSKRITVY